MVYRSRSQLIVTPGILIPRITIFFERFLYRGATAFCDAVSASNQARFYRLVAQFARTFLDIEKSAFEMVG